MKYNPDKHCRRSIRLKGYDYSQAGIYFVTICTKNKKCLFGEIKNDKMILNQLGYIVQNEWIKTSEIRNNVTLDSFVIMPNHLHGIIIINNDVRRGVLQYAPTANAHAAGISQYAPTATFRSPSQTIGAIVRGFKSVATKRINEIRKTPGLPLWQRNYYEHIIRNENDLGKIQQYILINSAKWEFDRNNLQS
jgi:REP element-mobilizing transposase RayT